MVLMSMGQDDAEDVVSVLLDELRVGQDDVDARRRLVAEGHADVDDDPLAVVRRAKAVAVEVHADLVRPAKRQEDEFVDGARLAHTMDDAWLLRRKISKRPRMVKSWSKTSILAVAPANSEATPPVATTVSGWPYSARMRSVRPSIRPT